MSITLLESVGFIGSVIIVIAYLPQIIHLVKVKDSSGVSFGAWIGWLVGEIMLLIYSISIRDKVYITLAILSTSSILLVLFLKLKYRK